MQADIQSSGRNAVAIAQGQLALELCLAGVPVRVVNTAAEVETMVSELLETNLQLVILDESYLGGFSEWFSARLARHSGLPLVIFSPSFEKEDADTDAYINRIVKPAVGFEIRLD